MKNYFIPRQDADKMKWLNNFSAKLPNYKATLGITDPQITAFKNDAQNFAYIIGTLNLYREYDAQMTEYKNMLRQKSKSNAPLNVIPAAPATPVFPQPVVADIFGRVTKFVKTLKGNPNINDAISSDLGIIGTEVTTDYSKLKPLLTYEYIAGQPNIKWKKKGLQGIHIYVDRNDGKGFHFLASDTKPDFLDKTPLPASGTSTVWKYKVIYIKDDEEVGMMSDEIVLQVMGIV